MLSNLKLSKPNGLLFPKFPDTLFLLQVMAAFLIDLGDVIVYFPSNSINACFISHSITPSLAIIDNSLVQLSTSFGYGDRCNPVTNAENSFETGFFFYTLCCILCYSILCSLC